MTNAEIQVGEYVRTYNGAIFKVVGGNADDYLIDIDYVDLGETENEDYYWLNYNDNGRVIGRITKFHSHDIIDLIEVGDYVNGLKVYDIEKAENIATKKDCIAINMQHLGATILHEKSVKSIVTKEQFKSMEYKVGGQDDR